MRISELVRELYELQSELGDVEVVLDIDPRGNDTIFEPVFEAKRVNLGSAEEPRMAAYITT